ncbi:MAG: glycosyltransferase family 2 protein, partial [Flavobacterium sp.]
MAFFSVIIPVYNKERFLVHTVNSVLNQSFTDFELLLIDDGST